MPSHHQRSGFSCIDTMREKHHRMRRHFERHRFIPNHSHQNQSINHHPKRSRPCHYLKHYSLVGPQNHTTTKSKSQEISETKMSNMPLISETKQRPWYGASADQEETTTLLIKSSNKNNTDILDVSTAEVIYELFLQQEGNWDDLFAHPKTNPKMTPEKRFKRHRNYYVYQLNQFRHWWKTSRLLVRVSGGYEYCQSTVNWVAMAAFKVTRRKQAKAAFRSMKAIGRGGPSKDFLNNVQPFTRSIRIVLAVARGWEARVDNRLVEVFLAEGLYVAFVRSAFSFANHVLTHCAIFCAAPLWATDAPDGWLVHLLIVLPRIFCSRILVPCTFNITSISAVVRSS